MNKPTYIELTQRIAFYRTQINKIDHKIGQLAQTKIVNAGLLASLLKERALLRK